MDELDDLWEYIGRSTYRLKVHAGWLIKSEPDTSSNGVALLFIPDVYNNWQLSKEEE